MLSGDITNLFVDMPFIRGIYLEDNSFSGRIDDNFLVGNQLLLHVDISANELTGYVPAHLFDPQVVPILELLDLHDNRISGVLPEINVAENREMNFLSLHFNNIGGKKRGSCVGRLLA